jgi:predicted nuclease of predicted toxin-antitoxin system
VKILFDQGTPVPLRRALSAREVATAYERGWGEKQNGDLLRAAEAEGFEAIIITTDQNLRYQQNLSERRLAVLVLLTTDWRIIRSHIDSVEAAVGALQPGDYRELPFPSRALN